MDGWKLPLLLGAVGLGIYWLTMEDTSSPPSGAAVRSSGKRAWVVVSTNPKRKQKRRGYAHEADAKLTAEDWIEEDGPGRVFIEHNGKRVRALSHV